MELFDQHVHTNFSPDSKELLETYVKYIKEHNRSTFVFTDHVDYDAKFVNDDVLIDYDEVRQTIDKLSHEYDIEILMGTEMGYRTDLEEKVNDYLDKYDFDIVLLSIHDHIKGDYYDSNLHKQFELDDLVRTYYNDVYSSVTRMDNYDVITHMDFLLRALPNRIDLEDYKEFIIPIFDEIIKKDKCVEINTKSIRTLKTTDYCFKLIDLYIECGGTEFTLGSDAHLLDDYEADFDIVIDYLKSKDINHLNIFKQRKAIKIEI